MHGHPWLDTCREREYPRRKVEGTGDKEAREDKKNGGVEGGETRAGAGGGAQFLGAAERTGEAPDTASVTVCRKHSKIQDSLGHRQWSNIPNPLQNSLA